ncbi:MAG TPA: lipoprotein [Burkholderiaceae bacterium]|nr:lipoprotein [Burkholderiaceae bacterium]
MKSFFHLIRLGAAAALLFAVSGCGQKGPLYLPAKPQPVVSAPAAPATQAAPGPLGRTSESQ